MGYFKNKPQLSGREKEMSEEKKKEKNEVSHLNWHQYLVVKQILKAARDNKILQGSLENLYRYSGFLTMIDTE